MKILAKEITDLLDKLYNLRGEDSVILKSMEHERVAAEETKDRTSKEKVVLSDKIEGLLAEEKELANQGSKLMEVLSGINTLEFSTVLERLNINFDPNGLRANLAEKLPATIYEVQNEAKQANEELKRVEEEMNSAITTIEELDIRRDTALSNQAKLNEYFSLALSGNINITRDSITSLLEQFDFTIEEQREAAKIMMFPEDALYDYDARVNELESPGKSISEVIAEARDYTRNLEEETIIGSTETERTPEIEIVEPVILEKEEIERPTFEDVNVVSPKQELINLMTECGLDYLDFTNNDLENILANYKEEVLRNNVALAKSNNMDLDIFVDNITLLYDTELSDKVNRLVSVGKAPLDIYLNPNILVKYDLAGLNNAINLLQINGLDPRKVPLMAY